MKRRGIGVLVAVALTLMGTFLLVGYVNGAEDRAVAGEKLVNILVVAQPVKKGTAASVLNGKVKQQKVPARVRAATAVTNLSSLRGLVTTADLAVGEQLVRGRFGKADSLDVSGAIDTTKLVKLTASLDPERAVGGQLKVGDAVVVVVSADVGDRKDTKVTIHQVPIVAITGAVSTSSSDKKDDSKAKSNSSSEKVVVTLGFTEQQAGQFVWGLEHGSIWLGLEPANADQSNLGTVDAGGIFG
jgi:pilus assembly protein CpaB